MSLHFLLDGYNIIKQTPDLNQGSLENQRLALLKWISVYKPQGNLANGVTVVFDGSQEFSGTQVIHGMKVVFSRGQSADELIKRIVEEYPKKSVVVVSDDKDIKLYVRALGASVLSVNDFKAKAVKKSRASFNGQEQKDKAQGKNLSLIQQNKINIEFTKIWIKSK